MFEYDNNEEQRSCPDHPFSGNDFIATPELVHHGKLICYQCGRFIGWVAKPDGDKRRRRGTKKLAKRMEDNGVDYCQICLKKRQELPDHETFVAHHVIEVRDGGTDDPGNIWHLCTTCHEMVHLLRRARAIPTDRPKLLKDEAMAYEIPDRV